ncbi:sodium-dependent glucose transporter 1-like [Oppia nitens]|uniref:sodium-dependent glucose transporter 1-like n=1 Tax=Oppia nitens TaxID=1686743 RepID=UPI0023DB1C94|nr:sodium-dependent glucose transporter 1-like [Oppia nitens]
MKSTSSDNLQQIKIVAPITNKHKQLLTWSLYLATITYGLIINVIGPVLHDLTKKYDTTTEEISYIFMCFYFGYFIGAILNSITFNYVNRHLSLVVILLIMAGVVPAIPYSPNLSVMFTLAFIAGYCTGGLDTALVVWIVEIWAEKSSIYMGGYQVFFSMGIVLGPVLAAPFVSDYHPNDLLPKQLKDSRLIKLNKSSLVANNYVDNTVGTDNNNKNIDNKLHYGNIEIPFIILGALLLLSALLLLAIHFYRRYTPPKKLTSLNVEQKSTDHNTSKWPDKSKLIYICLLVFTLGPYVGFEFMTFQLLPTYLEYSHLHMPPNEGDHMLTIMTVSFLAYCLISFFLSMKYWSKNSIYINWAAILIGNIILLVFNHSSLGMGALITGSIFIGIGLSTLYPSVFAFVESQIEISNVAGGLVVCACGFFSAIFPVICGKFVNENPEVIPIMNLILGTFGLTVFIILDILLYRQSKTNINNAINSNRPSLMGATSLKRLSFMGNPINS